MYISYPSIEGASLVGRSDLIRIIDVGMSISSTIDDPMIELGHGRWLLLIILVLVHGFEFFGGVAGQDT